MNLNLKFFLILLLLITSAYYFKTQNDQIEHRLNDLDAQTKLLKKEIREFLVVNMPANIGAEFSKDPDTILLLIKGERTSLDKISEKKDTHLFCNKVYILAYGPKNTIEIFQRIGTEGGVSIKGALKVFSGIYEVFPGTGVKPNDYFNNDSFWNRWSEGDFLKSDTPDPKTSTRLEAKNGQKFSKDSCD